MASFTTCGSFSSAMMKRRMNPFLILKSQNAILPSFVFFCKKLLIIGQIRIKEVNIKQRNVRVKMQSSPASPEIIEIEDQFIQHVYTTKGCDLKSCLRLR